MPEPSLVPTRRRLPQAAEPQGPHRHIGDAPGTAAK